jgi:hypothetical protein
VKDRPCCLIAVLAVACCGCDSGGGRQRVPVRREDCVLCHQDDYEATTSPPHAGRFPTACGVCHSTDAWVPAGAGDHPWFPLRNRHAEIACGACHASYDPGATPTQCDGCHHDDYLGATSPPHAGFSTECQRCHTDAGWRPAAFDHVWPLTGVHASTPCASCHPGDPPRYTGTPTDCVGCHRDDYDRSTFPDHQTFPLTCDACHTTSGWVPAFAGGHPEARFPVETGPHAGLSCASCHDASLGTSAGGANTNCVGCHEHERSRMADKHREVGGYRADDPDPHFCLACHPGGFAEGD